MSDKTTKPTVRALTVAELKKFIADTLAGGATVRRLSVGKGLFLEARARTQSASWVLRYKFAGIEASMGYGRFPDVSLAEARDMATEARKQLTAGVNPSEAKRSGLEAAAARHRHTVAAAVDEWLAHDSESLTSAKYAAQKRRRVLEALEHPKSCPLGGMPVSGVRTVDVTQAMDVFLKGGRDARDTYRKVVSDLSKAFDYAKGKGWRETVNPCDGILSTVKKPKTQGHRAPDPTEKELGEIVRALRAVQSTESFDYDTRLAKLLLLTGARTSEIRRALWSEVIDLDGEMPRIEVPAERMKKRKPWTCVLSKQAAVILRELKDNAEQRGVKASPMIFHKYQRRDSGYGTLCNENAVNYILKKAGLHDKVVGHGFRKLFSSAAHELWPYHAINREKAIEHSLAHVNSQTVEQTYNRAEYLPVRALLAQWWADYIDRAAEGAGLDNVVEFKRASAA